MRKGGGPRKWWVQLHTGVDMAAKRDVEALWFTAGTHQETWECRLLKQHKSGVVDSRRWGRKQSKSYKRTDLNGEAAGRIVYT